MNSITLILPCYNPPVNWVETIISSYSTLAKECPNLKFKLVIVNDGSKVSLEAIECLKDTIPNLLFYSYETNQGKGYALRYGVTHAPESDYYILTDIDFPFELDSTKLLILKLVGEEYDVLLGHRNQTNYYDKVPFIRRLISKLFRILVKQIAGRGITDTQCGLKGFSKQAKPYFLKTTINRYLFDLEFIMLFKNDKILKVGTFPVVLKEGIIFRKMGLKIVLT